MDAKSVLWSRLEKMMDTLHNCCVQIWHLQRVLSKIRDPNTHLQLLDILIKASIQFQLHFYIELSQES
jgi:hypothetical protein